jgi:hypothetical protein
MPETPVTGRLDLELACLLVVHRHRAVVGGTLAAEEVADAVLPLLDRLELDATVLSDLDTFGARVDEALARLVKAGWLWCRDYAGTLRYGARDVAEAAVEWVRTRLAPSPAQRFAFEQLDLAVTNQVLAVSGADLELADATGPASLRG